MVRTSPTQFFFVRANWEHRDNVSVLPCSPGKEISDLDKYNRYKPEPGEPYRPLIAMPNQLKQKIPWFSSCSEWFTAYDPPHALPTVTAFGPGPTSGRHPAAKPPAPAPTVTFDPGARKTAGAVPVPPFTDDPAVRRPKATIVPVPLPKLGGPNSEPSDLSKEDDGKRGGDPEHSSDSKQSSDTSDDPSQGDKSEEGNDPKHGSGNSGDPSQHNKSGEGNDRKKGSGDSDDPSQDNKSSSGDDAEQDSGDPSQGHDLKQGNGNSEDFGQDGNTKGNSDPKNDGGTGRDSNQGSDAQQSTGTSVNPGRKTDANIPSLPFRPTVAVNGDQDNSPLAGSVVPDEPNHIDNSNAVGRESERVSLGGSTNDVSNNLVPHETQSLALGTPTDSFISPNIKPIVTTIAGQAITAAPTAITIPGTIIKQGDPGVTLHGTSVALDTAGQLVVDSKIIAIPPGTNSKPLTTTVGGRIIVASSAGIVIAGTTLAPGDAGVSVDGTLLSLDTAGHFVVGSKTQTFESESVSLGTGTVGTFGPGGYSTPLVATLVAMQAGNVASETTKGNSAVSGAQAFGGKADDTFYSLRMKKVVVVFVAVLLAIFV